MDFKSLRAYEVAFDLAMKIFEILKKFPKEETYSLTDQIRRSSGRFVLIWQRPTEKETILIISRVN